MIKISIVKKAWRAADLSVAACQSNEHTRRYYKRVLQRADRQNKSRVS